jgi:hypothetical protein
MSWVRFVLLGVLFTSLSLAQTSSFHSSTRWRVETNLAYEALCFMNTLIADPFYLSYYQPEYLGFSAKFTPEVRGALEGLATARREKQIMLAGVLTFMFSARDPQTLDDAIKIAGDPGGLRRAIDAAGGAGYIPDAEWSNIERLLGAVQGVLGFLKAADFEAYWQANIKPALEARAITTRAFLERYNIIPTVETAIGFGLPSDEITVYLAYFNRPHGTRILGTRFIMETTIDDAEIARSAIHEMMHPPFNKSDPSLWKALEVLKNDAFLMDHFQKRNPVFNYNTFEVYLEENAVRALTQIIAERMGLGVRLETRWRQSEDEGMHVLAPALYVLMHEERFLEGKEVFQAFLLRMLQEGKLAPGTLEGLYARFLELR